MHFRYNGLGIFDRPGFGSVSFRKTIPASSFSEEDDAPASYEKAESIGSAGSLALRSSSGRSADSSESACAPVSAPNGPSYKAVGVFLTTLGMEEWISLFEEERIDSCALNLIEEDDLRQMGVPTGPRKKIMKALEERKHDMEHATAITDSKL